KGMNRFAWELRHQGAEIITKAKLDSGDPKKGPPVSPGIYTVKITADGKTVTTKVEVKMDPRVTEPRGVAGGKQPPQRIDVAPRVASAEEESRLASSPGVLRRNGLDLVCEECRDQEKFALRLRDDVTRVSAIVNDIRTIRKQLKLQEELLEKQTRAKAFLKQGRDQGKKLDELEEKR